MCDLFEANPWKPLLCVNCHQNRSGHDEQSSKMALDSMANEFLPNSNSSMHLYEEIMAQYFSINPTDLDSLPSTSNENQIDPDDSFTDEEQEICKPTTIEFIPNSSMINTQGIVLIGPDLPNNREPIKKAKKLHLLRKTKSNAEECLKKNPTTDGNAQKSWWFKGKKCPNENISSPPSNQKPLARIRVLPELNKLTLNEALNIARRQHGTQSKYVANSSASSTQSSNEYESQSLSTTYLVATVQENFHEDSIDKVHRLTFQRLTADLHRILDEYKNNLPVAHFQTLKSFLHQNQTSKNFSNESRYFLLLQLIQNCSKNQSNSFDQYLVGQHSRNLPILIMTNICLMNNDENQSAEPFLRQLVQQLFDSTSSPMFSDLCALETISCRILVKTIFPLSNINLDQSISVQRVQLIELFWNQIPSLRSIQINDDNEEKLFLLYHLMKRLNQLDI